MDSSLIEERKQRWKAFYQADTALPWLFIISVQPDLPRPPLWPDKKQERIEWIVTDYERRVIQAEKIDDDALPYADFITGTEIFAEAFGSPVRRGEGQMPYALPVVEDAAGAAGLRLPDLESTSLMLQFEIADEAFRRIGGPVLYKLPDIQSPMDIAALIWRKEAFFPAMLDDVGAVEALAEKVRILLEQFLERWFSRYGSSFIAHYPDYYMPGGISLSEDEIGAVSPAMFEEFFLPELNLLSRRFGGIGIHCCADSRHQWEGLARVEGLRVMNLNRPEEQLSESFAVFPDSVVQLPLPSPPAAVVAGGDTLPQGKRFILNYSRDTVDEAAALAGRLQEARVRHTLT